MKIQLKRSNVQDPAGVAKEPTAGQMEYGELAVNYNETDPAIFLKDSNDNIIRISGVGSISDDGQVELPSSSTPPSSAEPGNLWYNSEDGRLYIYYKDGNSEQWVDASPDSWDPTTYPDTDNPAEQPGSLDDRYVMASGDNMDGNLTLNTNSIVLSATDGSATFANGGVEVLSNGNMNSNGSITSTDGSSFASLRQGYIVLNAPSDFGTSIGNYTGTDYTWTIDASGSAEFASKVVGSGDVEATDGTAVARLVPVGQLFVRSATGVAIDVRNTTDATNPLFTVGAADGSIMTKSSIAVGDEVTSLRQTVNFMGGNTGPVFRIYEGLSTDNGADPAIALNNDGSITAGSITTDGDVKVGAATGGNRGINLYKDGGINIYNSASIAETALSVVDKNSNQPFIVTTDGSITAAGTYKCGNIDASAPNNSGVSLSGGGFCDIQSAQSSSADTKIFRVFYGPEKISFTNTGNADFAGDVTASNVTFNLEPDNDANYTTTTEEYEETIQVPVENGVTTAELVDGAPQQQFTEQTVTRTREIKTYTGPTLDVKEQLLAYEARFKQQDAVMAQMSEALKKLGADIDPPADATKKSTKKK